MSRWRGAAVALVVLGLVVFAIARLVESNGPPNARPLGLEDLEVPGSGVIRWSPDATKLAVIAAGELVVVRVADAKELSRTGGTVVDAAWMPDGGRLVLVEGPIPTGQVVAVRADGRRAGTTELKPSVAFGQGRGFGLDDRGTRAAVITATRAPIGGATTHDVGVVQLQTGEVRVFPTPGVEEANPVFVDGSTIAYSARGGSRATLLQTLDLETGEVRKHGTIHDGPFGVLASGEVVVGNRGSQSAYRLDAVNLDGATRVLGVLPRATRPVAIDRFGTRALVRRFGGFGGTRLAIEVLRT